MTYHSISKPKVQQTQSMYCRVWLQPCLRSPCLQDIPTWRGAGTTVCFPDLHPIFVSSQGAGGVVTDWRGSELSWWPSDKKEVTANFPGEVLACGDARAHAQALQKLAF